MASAAASSIWLKVAGLVGASGVALAAYGAHGFKPKDAHFAEVYKRANQQQMYHAALLAVAPFTKWVVVGGMAADPTHNTLHDKTVFDW